MIELLFWFLVSQTLTTLPDMTPGTEVRLVSADLLTVYATARVEGDELDLEGELAAGDEVRLLILQPDASSQDTEALGGKALFAQVSSGGDDILVQFEELNGPLSFKKWLQEERGITLDMSPKAGEQ